MYLANVPLGVFGTIWGLWRLREPIAKAEMQQAFDWLGSVTFSLGLGCFLLALSMIAFPLLGLPVIYALFVVGIVGLGGFIAAELRMQQPMLDLKLFRGRQFSFAAGTNALNGLARGAVLFVLIFFLQGPYGKDPLTAGLMMAPFGAAFMFVGPLSGYLSDRLGSRGLATAGLAVSALGLLALSTVKADIAYWQLALFMCLMGGGSGMFNSPNANALMSSVEPRQRGSAAGIYTMVMNTGMMLSIVIAFPLVLSRIPEDVMFKVFLYGGGMSGTPHALAAFEQGVHEAFLLSFAITLVAVLVSALRPSNRSEAEQARAKLSREPSPS